MTDTVKTSLARLKEPDSPRKALGDAPVAAPIGQVVGFSTPQAPAANSSGGIASPLTVDTVTGASSLQMVSSDGLLVMEYPLQINLTDADNRAVVVKFPG